MKKKCEILEFITVLTHKELKEITLASEDTYTQVTMEQTTNTNIYLLRIPKYWLITIAITFQHKKLPNK